MTAGSIAGAAGGSAAGKADRSRNRVLLYGASGFIGTRLAEAFHRQGEQPLLAGRNECAIANLASRLGTDYHCTSLTDPGAVRRMLTGVGVLVNAAGPFSATWRPLVDACLDAGVHYLDLTGEVDVIEQVRQCGAAARARGVMLLPAIGFDVVPSDCLAAEVAALVPGAQSLRFAVAGLDLVSRGSARTLVERVGRPVLVRRNGRLQSLTAPMTRRFVTATGFMEGVTVSWGDLATSYSSTGIPSIETYFAATPALRAVLGVNALLRDEPTIALSRALLATVTAAWPDGPTDETSAVRRATIIVEAEDAGGHGVRGQLETPEAYAMSTQTATAICAEVLAGNAVPGFQTPATLLGPRFIRRFDTVTVSEPVAYQRGKDSD